MVVVVRLGEKILVDAGQGGRAVVAGRLGEKVFFAGHGGRVGGGAGTECGTGTSGWRRRDDRVAAPGRDACTEARAREQRRHGMRAQQREWQQRVEQIVAPAAGPCAAGGGGGDLGLGGEGGGVVHGRRQGSGRGSRDRWPGGRGRQESKQKSPKNLLLRVFFILD